MRMIHVEVRIQLVPGIAVHIAAGDQQAVDALEQRIIHDPAGFRAGTDEALDHAGVVEAAEDVQCGDCAHHRPGSSTA